MVQVRVVMFLLVASCAGTGSHQEVALAPNASEDRPVRFTGSEPGEVLAKWRALVAPHVEQARSTYPEAKRRYLAGLPPRHTFFVTTLLRDGHGHFENVFVVVHRIAGQEVTGRIANPVNVVQGYRNGQLLSFAEADVIDWMISNPDGSEEGNFVGKFLDTLPRKN
jgi:uncharacterized protein YegJ (DUF2314 family)